RVLTVEHELWRIAFEAGGPTDRIPYALRVAGTEWCFGLPRSDRDQLLCATLGAIPVRPRRLGVGAAPPGPTSSASRPSAGPTSNASSRRAAQEDAASRHLRTRLVLHRPLPRPKQAPAPKDVPDA